MSFVTPQEYKQISNDLGDAFATIRDAINNSGSGDAYADVQTALVIVADSVDNDVRISQTIDPKGAIMNDLGTTWQNDANNKFTRTQASNTAANFFSSMLRKLNDHVKNRTLDPDTGAKHQTVQDWFNTYAFTTGNEAYSLFWNGGTAPDGTAPDGSGGTGAYFSQNFEDLCTALNITIPNAYKQSTYA